MSTTYTEADLPVYELVKTILERDFPQVAEAKVTITIMVAFNPVHPSVKLHGIPCAAKIKINSLADRSEGKHDATITLASEYWHGKTDRQKEALLWHELNHLVLIRDKQSFQVKLDDCQRPRLKTRPDDYTINGFTACGEKYGKDSPEFASLTHVVGVYKQLGLWKDWDAPASNGRQRAAASH